MSAARPALRVIAVLVRRDLALFFRQRSRLVGALAQPLLFWLVIGAGLAPSFRVPGVDDGPGYLEFFFPGVVLMVVLFASIFATMSVITDRREGFLQGVLAAPGPRGALAVGKCGGGALVALVQGALFLALMPLAGFSPAEVNWVALALALVLTSLALTAVGFVLAWWIDSTQGYHAVMSVVLIPLWILSGALFPVEPTHAALRWTARLNPVTYAVNATRESLNGAGFDAVGGDLLVLVAVALLALFGAARIVRRP